MNQQTFRRHLSNPLTLKCPHLTIRLIETTGLLYTLVCVQIHGNIYLTRKIKKSSFDLMSMTHRNYSSHIGAYYTRHTTQSNMDIILDQHL